MALQDSPQHAEQCFSTAVRDCLANAQQRLVEEVQRLAAELSVSVSDQVVQLHANMAHDLLQADSKPAMKAHAPLQVEASDPSHVDAKPRVLAPLVRAPPLPEQATTRGLNQIAQHGEVQIASLQTNLEQKRPIALDCIGAADGAEQLRAAASAAPLLDPPGTLPDSDEPSRQASRESMQSSLSGKSPVFQSSSPPSSGPENVGTCVDRKERRRKVGRRGKRATFSDFVQGIRNQGEEELDAKKEWSQEGTGDTGQLWRSEPSEGQSWRSEDSQKGGAEMSRCVHRKVSIKADKPSIDSLGSSREGDMDDKPARTLSEKTCETQICLRRKPGFLDSKPSIDSQGSEACTRQSSEGCTRQSSKTSASGDSPKLKDRSKDKSRPKLTRSSSKESVGTVHTTATSAAKMRAVGLHSVWKGKETRSPASRTWRHLRTLSHGTLSQQRFGLTPSKERRGSKQIETHRGIMRHCVMRPGNPLCIAWDLFTLAAMAHDVIIIPLHAFDLGDSAVLKALELLTSFIWLSDLILSFFRGVADSEEGVIEMRLHRIAFFYLRSWFALDFVVVIVDVLLLFMAGSSWVEVILLVRMLRILRLARLAKIVKVTERMTIFEGQFSDILASTEKRAAVLSILKLLMMMVVVNHFAACGWYGIGLVNGGTPEDRHWTEVHFPDGDFSIGYRYGTAFHWALTQLTPASMEVTPTNSMERAYNILMIFGGMLMFSTIVSAMTQTQLHIQQISAAEKQQRQGVRRYIAANSVSIGLSSSIFLFLKRNKEGHKRILLERDVGAIGTLPEHMIMELRFEVFAPALTGHGLFALLGRKDLHSLQMICHNGVLEMCVLRSEDVFQNECQANHMYFVTSGSLAYFPGYEACYEELVARGRWVSEAILWIEWEHTGRLSGESRCTGLFQVNASQFLRFASQAECSSDLRRYARHFALEANEALESLSDLWTSMESVQRMMRQSVNKKGRPVAAGKKLLTMLFPDAQRTAFEIWKRAVHDRKHRQNVLIRCCSWLRRGGPFARNDLIEPMSPMSPDGFRRQTSLFSESDHSISASEFGDGTGSASFSDQYDPRLEGG